jgi:hypothetical protein
MGVARDDAELISTQAVGATVGRDRGLEALGELSQQRVTGWMAEAVVVRLEAVEVEEREYPRVGLGLGELREVLHELTAVGETCQGIGACLRPASREQAPVLAVHEHQRDDEQRGVTPALEQPIEAASAEPAGCMQRMRANACECRTQDRAHEQRLAADTFTQQR